MRTALVSLGLAVVVAAPAALVAAPALRGVMHAWRADAAGAHAMLYGRRAFDQATISRTLQTFAADAGNIAAQVNGHTASARDFKRRFLAFQGEANAALTHVGQPSALKADFSRLLSDCQSCHHIYNN